MANNIKLLICYHKKAPLFKDEILTPIHVGRENALHRLDPDSENYKWLMENMIGDNTGDNISALNDSYNEMTALYWAWKNYDKLGNPDYIGLMHYRRHFVLHEGEQKVYNIQDFNQDTYYDVINYSVEKLQKLVEGCDFVTHIGRVQHVYRHFIENQRKTDIDTANEIVLEKYPEYKEVMEEYYTGNDSNFCNMNIFSREIFFRYCEWIFDILGEFEKRVDINEKRFFISERLTGIFVAKLMKDEKYKYKRLPISFIDEPTKVPVAIAVNEDNMTSAAVTITSIMENATGYHSYQFYILCSERFEEVYRSRFINLIKKYDKCEINFIENEIESEYIPIYLSQLLPKVNKCIYINGDVLAMFDIAEFYRICSTDDYFIVGLPLESYHPEFEDKKISSELMVINCKRMRNHDIAKKAGSIFQNIFSGVEAINELCKGELGYLPWYLFTSEKLDNSENKLFDKYRTRGRIQEETLWRPFLIYDLNSPIENNQGVYSIFWWNMMRKLPLYFQNIDVMIPVLNYTYATQQNEVNVAKEKITNPYIQELSEQPNIVEPQSQQQPQPQEDWRSYSLWGKLKFYYRHNGFKQTVKYMGHKVFK